MSYADQSTLDRSEPTCPTMPKPQSTIHGPIPAMYGSGPRQMPAPMYGSGPPMGQMPAPMYGSDPRQMPAPMYGSGPPMGQMPAPMYGWCPPIYYPHQVPVVPPPPPTHSADLKSSFHGDVRSKRLNVYNINHGNMHRNNSSKAEQKLKQWLKKQKFKKATDRIHKQKMYRMRNKNAKNKRICETDYHEEQVADIDMTSDEEQGADAEKIRKTKGNGLNRNKKRICETDYHE
eukprot:458814_1